MEEENHYCKGEKFKLVRQTKLNPNYALFLPPLIRQHHIIRDKNYYNTKDIKIRRRKLYKNKQTTEKSPKTSKIIIKPHNIQPTIHT